MATRSSILAWRIPRQRSLEVQSPQSRQVSNTTGVAEHAHTQAYPENWVRSRERRWMEIESSPQKTPPLLHNYSESPETLQRIISPFSKLVSEQFSLWLSRIQLPTWGKPQDKWETKLHFLVRKAGGQKFPLPHMSLTSDISQLGQHSPAGLVIFWLCDDHRNSLLLLPRLPPMEKVDKTTTVTLSSSLDYGAVQLLSCVRLFVIPWTAACQFSLPFTIPWSFLKLTSIESAMPGYDGFWVKI